MSDKELLELAAKAAGIEVNTSAHIPASLWVSDNNGRTWYEWNPLADDGDALRLAVKLELEVCTTNGRDIETNETYKIAMVVGPDTDCVESHRNSDPYAATRRAIVRAAAEIGRGMR